MTEEKQKIPRRAKPKPLTLEKQALTKQQQEIDLRLQELRSGLPHLYGRPWYAWAWEFFQSTNKINLLCSGNQVSKSSTQIRKCIEWAGNPSLWPKLWPQSTPRQFWYLYPSKEVASEEFELKWVPEFLPRFGYQSHKTYGWEPIKDKGVYVGVQFNSGIRVLFKSYMQNVSNLQTGTVHAMFTDEELPEHLYSELISRMSAAEVQGYFHMVFTATLNQQMWQRAIEGSGESELFPDALKIQVSLYDCQTYRDGTPGPYTEEIIKRVIGNCKSPAEVQRRVFGRFISDLGRKYSQFDPSRHFKKAFPIPADWKRYGAVDIGSGGPQDGRRENHAAHPPAIVFVAVRPDYRLGVAYKGWRGDDGKDYTAGDIFLKFQELRGKELLVAQKFDQQAKDFGVIAQRANDPFLPSVKSHDQGEDVVNTLFKNDMLFIFDDEELQKLGGELMNVLKSTPKRVARDDFCDALRYDVVDIPWDWSVITGELTDEQKAEAKARPLTEKERIAQELEERRNGFIDEKAKNPNEWAEIDAEFEFWNNCAGG